MIAKEKETSVVMYEDAAKSIAALCKGSRLRSHYIKLVVMNNMMRAFIAEYEIPEDYKSTQEVLLTAMLRVEERHDRKWLVTDKIILQYALINYGVLLNSVNDAQLRDLLLFIDRNADKSKYAVLTQKSINKQIRKG